MKIKHKNAKTAEQKEQVALEQLANLSLDYCRTCRDLEDTVNVSDVKEKRKRTKLQ